ncbi:MAG: RCC1 repeat- and reductase domain-containing protein [Proteobacteria bacterium]|nr:RCC1 repeat- and reductase domain-containing protein [Pseudomonadota bacterium]
MLGRNEYGQLGDGTTVDRASPVAVTALGTAPAVESVTLGYFHSCARRADGTLWCWGRNYYGQLGDGTTVDRPSPVAVTALGTAVAEVALGAYHSCARRADGSLACWGTNWSGQLGDGTTVNRPSPVAVTALGTTVAEVALGGAHSCARRANGSLWCWGAERWASSATARRVPHSPVAITALGTAVAQVALGGSHSCARRADGSLWCWGLNDDGQLGDGTTGFSHTSPMAVPALGTAVAQVALGGNHSCVRRADGSLWCWGLNDDGQLGDGTLADVPSPARAIGLGCDCGTAAAPWSSRRWAPRSPRSRWASSTAARGLPRAACGAGGSTATASSATARRRRRSARAPWPSRRWAPPSRRSRWVTTTAARGGPTGASGAGGPTATASSATARRRAA